MKFKGEVKEDENFELRMGGEEREEKIEGGKQQERRFAWGERTRWLNFRDIKIKSKERYFICPVSGDGDRVDNGDIDGDGVGGGDNCVFIISRGMGS